MTKADMIKEAAQIQQITQKEATRYLDFFLSQITEELKVGNDVTLHGFGKFSTKTTAARTGRNPITGDPVDIPAKRKVVFKPQKMLKEAVQE
jgi:DNA-binding protein HU-beta